MTAVTFREERGKNGDFFFRLPVPEWEEGGKRFKAYYRDLTALLSSLSPERTGYSSVTGTGRAITGPQGLTTVLLLYRFWEDNRPVHCFLDTVTWGADGNVVPLGRLIGKKAAGKAMREGNDGWYVGENGAVLCRFRIGTDSESGRVRPIFRETGTIPFLCRKKESCFPKNC